MSSVMRWRSGLALAWKEVMIGLLLENEADCLIRQHMEPRGRPLPDAPAFDHSPYRASGLVRRPDDDSR